MHMTVVGTQSQSEPRDVLTTLSVWHCALRPATGSSSSSNYMLIYTSGSGISDGISVCY